MVAGKAWENPGVYRRDWFHVGDGRPAWSCGCRVGDVEHKSNLHSCRKSLLNSLIGIAIAEGKINPDETLDNLGIDDNKPSLTKEEKRATVRDLLEARSGVYHPTVYETKGMEEEKPARGSHAPGTFWYYNNWDFNTLGFIYEKATGERIFNAFYRRIAQPIGMQDFKPSDGEYISSGIRGFLRMYLI